MTSDPKIANLRRRVQNWLSDTPSATAAGDDGTIEGLEADIDALERKLRSYSTTGQSPERMFEALREQGVLPTVLESMVEGVVVADMDGNLLVFNAAARTLLGREAVDTGPESWSEEYGFFHADAKTPCPSEQLPLNRAMAGEFVYDEVLVVRTPGRPEDCYIKATARPLRSDDNAQLGAVVVFHDVTSTKALERELRRARESAEENARAKSAFLANMSHEIRTPLTAVLGFSDLLLDPRLDKSHQLNYAQSVRRNGEHLLALINDVLDLSKIDAEQVQVESVECSIHHVLHDVTSLMQVRAHDKGIGFEVVYETPIPAMIESDPMRVRQVLLNLLSNAIKFTQEGGVLVTARCLDAGTEAARVEIAVSDTGIGLSEAEMAGLFQSFHQANASTTRQFGGTGLGLAICRSLAELIGGEVTVSSTPGEGSTFTLTLYQPIDAQAEMIREPSMLAAELEGEASNAPGSTPLTGRILLAEDGPDNQVLVSTLLRRQGLEVTIAEDGEAAVAQALAARDSGACFDIILMDMQMPKLDGYGATARLRTKGYSGPILALTAHALDGERQRCIAAGCDDYLSKPIERSVLIGAVQAHLHRVQGGNPEPAAGSDAAEEASAIVSSYADDPDMAELVAGFVERLPMQLQDLRAAADEGDMELFRRLAHQLKGAAGSYGFMAVSQEAEALEAAAREASETRDVQRALDSLVALCERVRPGGE